jgi:hypothetical protein
MCKVIKSHFDVKKYKYVKSVNFEVTSDKFKADKICTHVINSSQNDDGDDNNNNNDKNSIINV